MADQPIRILSTRPLEPMLLQQAAADGMQIDTLPFIVTEPLVEAALGSRLAELASRPIVAVFTSMNAVEMVAKELGLTVGPEAASTRPPAADPLTGIEAPPAAGDQSTGINTRPATAWQIYCIGHATQQLVRQYFGEGVIAGTADSAGALADVIIGSIDTREVFFFCGDQRRDELPEKLEQQGIRVNERVVYRTVQTPHKVEAIYDGVIFFSPSAVHSFFTANTPPASTILFAIGATTAHTIRSYTTNRVILSGSPEKEGLIRQVIDYYNIKP